MLINDDGLDTSDDDFDNDPFANKGSKPAVVDDKPKKFESVREAIDDALSSKQKDDDEKADQDAAKARSKKKAEAENKVPNGKKNADNKASDKNKVDDNDEDDAGDDDTSEKSPKDIKKVNNKEDRASKPNESTTPKDLKPPVGWSKAAKASWNTLSDEVKSSIAKREEEASKGFKEYGEKTARLKEFDDVIAKYVPDYQQYGATPPQLVERTMQWLNALRNPNRADAVGAFKKLAQSFGMDEEIRKAYSNGDAKNTDQNSTVNNDPNSEAVAQLQRQIEEIKAQSERSVVQQAEAKIKAWAADKPHFDKVRKSMRALLSDGSIPLTATGEYNLDEAYNRAVRADPELFEEMREAELQRQKEELEAQLAERKAARKNVDDLNRAKRANVSLKPVAPTSNSAPRDLKAKPLSVRESIDAAMQEIAGS